MLNHRALGMFQPFSFKQDQNGFTLIELLVVMTVISVFFVMFVRLSDGLASSNDIEDQLSEQAQQFIDVSVVASDQAVLSGDPIGLVITAPLQPPENALTWRYYWQLYRGGQWVDAAEPLIANELAEGLELALTLEGEEIDFTKVLVQSQNQGQSQDQNADQETEIPLPSIIFFPGGEITPFRLTIYDGQEFDKQILLSSERTGQVQRFENEDQIYEEFEPRNDRY